MFPSSNDGARGTHPSVRESGSPGQGVTLRFSALFHAGTCPIEATNLPSMGSPRVGSRCWHIFFFFSVSLKIKSKFYAPTTTDDDDDVNDAPLMLMVVHIAPIPGTPPERRRLPRYAGFEIIIKTRAQPGNGISAPKGINHRLRELHCSRPLPCATPIFRTASIMRSTHNLTGGLANKNIAKTRAPCFVVVAPPRVTPFSHRKLQVSEYDPGGGSAECFTFL